MDNYLNSRELAMRVVRLIEERDRTGLDEAISLLNDYYPGDAAKAASAYEMACLVVVNRSRGKVNEPCNIKPDADWLAMRASQAIQEGRTQEAFGLLRIASGTGAKPSLCRSVVFQLLRGLDNSERVTELYYTPTSIVSIEIGRVAGAGFILVPNEPTPKRQVEWNDARSGTHPGETLYLRNFADISNDTASGCIEYRKTGRNRATLGRINWMKYLNHLSLTESLDRRDQIPKLRAA